MTPLFRGGEPRYDAIIIPGEPTVNHFWVGFCAFVNLPTRAAFHSLGATVVGAPGLKSFGDSFVALATRRDEKTPALPS